jgi:hypothetical protein
MERVGLVSVVTIDIVEHTQANKNLALKRLKCDTVRAEKIIIVDQSQKSQMKAEVVIIRYTHECSCSPEDSRKVQP